MPKAEKGSVKDIGNRMKARGLQKLRFYCQMCQKQCRDANGFKCHSQSESHMRQMKIFSDNAGGFMERYSKEFETSFLSTLKMRHGTKKVNANNVYQEVIADKEHIHMNATHWTTLTEFVQYLGKTGKCIVEEGGATSDNAGGWQVSYIERDSGILARREARQQREAADHKAEAALLERMKAQRIAAAKALDRAGGSLTLKATSINVNNNDAVVLPTFKLSSSSSSKTTKKKLGIGTSAFGDDVDDDDENVYSKEQSKRKASNTNVEKMMMETTRKQAATNNKSADPTRTTTTKKRKRDGDHHRRQEENIKGSSKDDKRNETARNTQQQEINNKNNNWLYRDILVRVVSKQLAGGKYFRKKAVVDKVLENGFAAEVEVLGDNGDGVDGDILRLDQDDLETVIPKVSSNSSSNSSKPKKVRILRGEFRGEKATVEYLDKSKYRADLVMYTKHSDDRLRGRRLKKVSYEDFSQIA